MAPEGTTLYVGAHYEVQPLPASPPPTPQPPSSLPKRAFLPLVFNNYLTVDGQPAQSVKYYLINGQRSASRTGSAGPVTYYYHDQLGSTVGSSANEATRYFPYGATRSGSVNTAYQFTGQRREAAAGLYFFQSRWYDGAIGRFVQPDPLIPEPGDPQSLNRYAHVRNNPLRFTDPTGMFSEDEIIKYYGVKTWDEVLAIFGTGGKLEGQWGWLETLRQAKLGDEVWFNTNASLTSPDAEQGVQFKGVFAEDKEGQLRIRHLSEDNSLLDPDATVRTQSARSYALFRSDPSSQLAPRLWVGEWEADRQYIHLRSVDWNRLLDPIAGEHLVAAAGITLFTGGFTVAQFAGTAALCVEPMTCAGGVLMGFNGLASLTATYFLGQGTSALVEHHWRESTVYGP